MGWPRPILYREKRTRGFHYSPKPKAEGNFFWNVVIKIGEEHIGEEGVGWGWLAVCLFILILVYV